MWGKHNRITGPNIFPNKNRLVIITGLRNGKQFKTITTLSVINLLSRVSICLCCADSSNLDDSNAVEMITEIITVPTVDITVLMFSAPETVM